MNHFFTSLDVVSPRGPIRNNSINPLKSQPHKMVKHNKIIRQQQLTTCLSVFDHFVGFALKGLKQQNCFSLKKKKTNELAYYVTKKTLDLNSLAPNNCIFLPFLNVHFLNYTDD